MTGTHSQVEWAEQIKRRVSAEFERVERAFAEVAGKQSGQDRRDTEAVIEILHEKRREVMSNGRADYFIRHWQELRDQVRKMVAEDVRYLKIKEDRAARASQMEVSAASETH